MEVRLQKFLAEAGIASRRRSEMLITSGLVSVNNDIVTKLGTKIDPHKDVIRYKNKIINNNQKLIYLLLNKPVGYISSAKDPRNRKTVLDLINESERVFPVGRLDYNSSGLLIITNDGDLTYTLTHPKHHVPKTYKVKVKGRPEENKINVLRKGTDLGVYKISKCKIKFLVNSKDSTTYEVVLHEGKNRQIRRMFDYIGHSVISLKRICIGEIKLRDLKEGQYRRLTEKEVNYLK
ncbi:MAG: pseudouridine synthase, partial [Eubacteriales bacterium]